MEFRGHQCSPGHSSSVSHPVSPERQADPHPRPSPGPCGEEAGTARTPCLLLTSPTHPAGPEEGRADRTLPPARGREPSPAGMGRAFLMLLYRRACRHRPVLTLPSLVVPVYHASVASALPRTIILYSSAMVPPVTSAPWKKISLIWIAPNLCRSEHQHWGRSGRWEHSAFPVPIPPGLRSDTAQRSRTGPKP